jgi:hypothetical protein
VELSTSLIYEPSDPNQTIRSAPSSHRIAINYRFQNLSACSTAVAMPSSRVTDSSVLLSAVGNRVASANLASSSSFMLPLESSSDVMCLITSSLGDFFLSANDKDRALYALSSLPSVSPPPPPCSLPWVFEAYPSSAYCVDTGPYLGLCAGRSQQKNHHSAHSHSTRQATAPSTTTATTHPRTQFLNPPPRDAVWVVGSGIPGEQTLTKDVLGSAADWHTLTKLDILRKERLDPSERPAATPGGAEEENSRHIADTRDPVPMTEPHARRHRGRIRSRDIIPIASSASAPTQLTHHPPCAASPAAPCTLFVVVSRSVTCLHWRCSMKCLNKCDI